MNPIEQVTKTLQAAGVFPKPKCEPGKHQYEYEDYDYSDDVEGGMDYKTKIGTCKVCGDSKDIQFKE